MSDRRVVLIVDDNQDIVVAASLRLRAAGFEPISAHDGIEGLAIAISERPDAIVLDVRMPIKDGLTVLAELRRRLDTGAIPVVMLSASIVDQQAALDAGASFFIKKPYEGAQLVRAVSMAMARGAPLRVPRASIQLNTIARHSAEQIRATTLQLVPSAEERS